MKEFLETPKILRNVAVLDRIDEGKCHLKLRRKSKKKINRLIM